METTTNTYQPTMPSTTDLPSSQYYQHIVDLPLSRFVDITTSGLLYPLIISGVPTADELTTAWDKIIEEYSTAMGNGEQQLYLSLFKEVNRLTFAIEEVAICVKWLRNGFSGKLVSRLNGILNTTFVFDVKDPEGYDQNLQRALNRSKGFVITRDIKLAQLEALQQKQEGEGGSKPTKEYYQNILLTLGEGRVFYEADKLTVYMFCELIKRFNKKIQEAESKAKR